MHKRREQPRLKFAIIVKDKKHHKEGITRNISIDGCFIEKERGFSTLLPTGSTIELFLDLPNAEKKIKVTGEVTHHGTHEDGMGISFKKIDKESITLIRQFIKTFLDDEPGQEWERTKAEYWEEVDRLKEKTRPHDDHA